MRWIISSATPAGDGTTTVRDSPQPGFPEALPDRVAHHWDEVWQGAAATGVDIDGQQIEFPGLAGKFINPKAVAGHEH